MKATRSARAVPAGSRLAVYPFRQSRADLARPVRTRQEPTAGCGGAARRVLPRFRLGWLAGVFPIPVTVIYFLLAAGLAAGSATGCTGWSRPPSPEHGALGRGGGGHARRGTALADDERHAQAACIQCFHVTTGRPTVPRVRELHHDLRPSRLGLIIRRCECGTHIPTMASRAAWHLTAVCKRCQESLPEGDRRRPRYPGPRVR